MDCEKYMRRALQLARNGIGYASPNPMVGAVIVSPDGTVIGEGWHRRCGEGHAEVNAVASVKECDRHLLSSSTMFVTLEPCAHYGKTPPCAELLLRNRIPKVVVGTVDPFSKVSGRGISMLREAGTEVVVGVLEAECRQLNRRFFHAHTSGRPFVTLKFAHSADGFMDRRRSVSSPGAFRFSDSLTSLATMRLRALHDAVLTTASTAIADGSRLTIRGWPGRQPLRVVVDRRGILPGDAPLFSCDASAPLVFTGMQWEIGKVLETLYSRHGITSVLVEAGPTLLSSLIDQKLWDAARVEVSPLLLGDDGTHPAPRLPSGLLVDSGNWNGNRLDWYLADGL